MYPRQTNNQEKRIMKKILIILIALLILSGCSEQSANPTSVVLLPLPVISGEEQAGTAQKFMQELGDNTFIDAEVKIPASLKIPIIDAELVSFDNEKVKSIFF